MIFQSRWFHASCSARSSSTRVEPIGSAGFRSLGHFKFAIVSRCQGEVREWICRT
jgi:hypothetical protein